MNNTSTNLKNTLYVAMAILLIAGCNDDNVSYGPIAGEDQVHNDQSIRWVNANDIPEIMDFASQQSGGTFQFPIREHAQGREADITVGTIDTTDVVVITNQFDVSNYTFKLNKDEPDGEISALEYIVRETPYGLYSYIMKYRPDTDWLNSNDWAAYTGELLFYKDDGTYVGTFDFINGVQTNRELVDPCCTTGDCTTGGGNTGGGGGGSTGGGGGGGGGSGGGSGSNICVITIIFNCCNRNFCDVHQPRGNPLCSGSSLFVHIECPNQRGNLADILRTPSDCPTCHDQVGDPCPCAADGVSCATTVDDNGSTGSTGSLPSNPCERLNARMDQQDFLDKVSELNDASFVMPPNDRFENLYTMSGLGINTTNSSYQSGANSMEIPGVALPANPTGVMHNHFFMNENRQKSLNVPSASDLFTLYLWARKQKINNSNSANFHQIMVYQNGMFNFQVTDINALITFGDTWLVENPNDPTNQLIQSNFLAHIYEEEGVTHSNDQNVNRDNLARLLDKIDDALGLPVGIELYYSPVQNPNWQQVKPNPNGSVTLQDCN